MFDRFFYSILGFYCLSQGVFAIITKKLLLKVLKPIMIIYFYVLLYLLCFLFLEYFAYI